MEISCNHDYIDRHQTCEDCGLIVNERKQSRSNSSDSVRCYIRKTDEKSIFKELNKLHFESNIIQIANDLYRDISQDKTFRGTTRKAVIFACVFKAYQINGTARSCESLLEHFDIQKKDANKGVKIVNSKLPSSMCSSITINDLIIEIMKQFYASPEQIQVALHIYRSVKDRSDIINRSKPKSIATSVIYYYMSIQPKPISVKEYSLKVNISELTIQHIVDEIKRICSILNLNRKLPLRS